MRHDRTRFSKNAGGWVSDSTSLGLKNPLKIIYNYYRRRYYTVVSMIIMNVVKTRSDTPFLSLRTIRLSNFSNLSNSNIINYNKGFRRIIYLKFFKNHNEVT